jgi:hypothetical protein
MEHTAMDEATNAAIARELARARQALAEGNAGMARVCARRAAGEAIAALERARPGCSYGMNAMVRLDGLAGDAAVPVPVREAATRLRAKRGEEGERPESDNPLADAELIIAHAAVQIVLP